MFFNIIYMCIQIIHKDAMSAYVNICYDVYTINIFVVTKYEFEGRTLMEEV